jgi:hypothetical protein
VLTGDIEQFRKELATSLAEFGLYPREASAMVETWRDSWFEEGTRVLYIVSRQEVDSLLPLRVTPTVSKFSHPPLGRRFRRPRDAGIHKRSKNLEGSSACSPEGWS